MANRYDFSELRFSAYTDYTATMSTLARVALRIHTEHAVCDWATSLYDVCSKVAWQYVATVDRHDDDVLTLYMWDRLLAKYAPEEPSYHHVANVKMALASALHEWAESIRTDYRVDYDQRTVTADWEATYVSGE